MSLGAIHSRPSALMILLIVPLFIPGCATRPAVMSYYRQPVQKASFELVDQRPEEERATRRLSGDRGSCNYGVRQFGDEGASPDRFTLLTDNLDSRLHKELTGKSLLITHYTIYVNDSDSSRPSGRTVGQGFLGSLIQRSTDNRIERRCRGEQMSQGLLEPGDVTKPISAVIINITLSVDGRAHSVHSIYSTDADLAPTPGDPDTTDVIFDAIKKASDQLIAELAGS